jgi:uncharacterized protein YjbI with pentapeptide repeats
MRKKILSLNLFMRRIPEMPIATSAIVLFFATIIVIHLSLPLYNSNFDAFYSNILAEAHGMLFDIFFMGIIIFWLNQNAERKQNINKFLNDIDDLRYWDSEEAAYKNVGNIKRLNREKVYKLNLSHCYLRKTTLNKVNLENSNFNSSDLSDCSLISANLRNTRFNQANLSNARLDFAELENAHLSGANLKGSSPIRANFKSANLIKANFENALLMETNFEEACLIGCNFKNANLSKANLKTAIGLTLDQLLDCKSLYKANIDSDLKLKILEKKPALLDA